MDICALDPRLGRDSRRALPVNVDVVDRGLALEQDRGEFQTADLGGIEESRLFIDVLRVDIRLCTKKDLDPSRSVESASGMRMSNGRCGWGVRWMGGLEVGLLDLGTHLDSFEHCCTRLGIICAAVVGHGRQKRGPLPVRLGVNIRFVFNEKLGEAGVAVQRCLVERCHLGEELPAPDVDVGLRLGHSVFD